MGSQDVFKGAMGWDDWIWWAGIGGCSLFVLMVILCVCLCVQRAKRNGRNEMRQVRERERRQQEQAQLRYAQAQQARYPMRDPSIPYAKSEPLLSHQQQMNRSSQPFKQHPSAPYMQPYPTRPADNGPKDQPYQQHQQPLCTSPPPLQDYPMRPSLNSRQPGNQPNSIQQVDAGKQDQQYQQTQNLCTSPPLSIEYPQRRSATGHRQSQAHPNQPLLLHYGSYSASINSSKSSAQRQRVDSSSDTFDYDNGVPIDTSSFLSINSPTSVPTKPHSGPNARQLAMAAAVTEQQTFRPSLASSTSSTARSAGTLQDRIAALRVADPMQGSLSLDAQSLDEARIQPRPDDDVFTTAQSRPPLSPTSPVRAVSRQAPTINTEVSPTRHMEVRERSSTLDSVTSVEF